MISIDTMSLSSIYVNILKLRRSRSAILFIVAEISSVGSMTQRRGAKMALFEMLFVVDHVTTSRISEWVERMVCWCL